MFDFISIRNTFLLLFTEVFLQAQSTYTELCFVSQHLWFSLIIYCLASVFILLSVVCNSKVDLKYCWSQQPKPSLLDFLLARQQFVLLLKYFGKNFLNLSSRIISSSSQILGWDKVIYLYNDFICLGFQWKPLSICIPLEGLLLLSKDNNELNVDEP